jgi:hemolysin D
VKWPLKIASSHDDFHAAKLAFLPAALEVQHTPPHPLARWLACSVALLVLLALLWSIVGKVDMVAIAEGKIIPSARVQQIQPLEKGVVSEIFVREGQWVNAGDRLVALDRTVTEAERHRVMNELQTVEATLSRNQHFLMLLNGNENSNNTSNSNNADTLLQQQWQQYQAQIAALQSQQRNREAEQRANREAIKKLQATLPINTQRANNMRALAEKKLIAHDHFLTVEETRITQQQDLAAATAHDAQLSAAIEEVKQNRTALLAQTRSQTLLAIQNGERDVESLRQQLQKVSDADNKQILYAPVAGQVKDLSIHTEGGVVVAAQQLMLIVPSDAQLEIEAWLPNKDIGFVQKNAEAAIKVSTFPFTKYGTLSATVINIADDATQDEKATREKSGLLYRMNLLLNNSTIQVDGREEKLLPGMQVTAEIVTGQRRLIDFFIEPVKKHMQESMRER